jgi:hypothetical protein
MQRTGLADVVLGDPLQVLRFMDCSTESSRWPAIPD